MPNRRKINNSHKKRFLGKRSPIILMITIVMIVLIILLLEIVKNMYSEKSLPIQVNTERHKIPKHQTITQQQQSSSVLITSHKTAKNLNSRKSKNIVPGSIAIIVDDMGGNMREVNALLEISIPLTYAIIPGLSKSNEVAIAAHNSGHEVIVHIPMEPKGYQNKPYEKDGLLLVMSKQEILSHMNNYFTQVPFAAGANNHMGSNFTEHDEQMRIVLNYLKARGLFFVDSKTSPNSLGDRIAREIGVDTAARSVFIDNVQNQAAIRFQLDQLVSLARKHGSAIGICHPHKITVKTLAALLPELQREGITFVYASDLAR